jgi:hypothetical protein
VQPLRRHVDVDAALAVGDGEPRLGPEERLVLDADVVDAADGDVALGAGIAVADHHVPHDVRARVAAVAVPALARHRRPVGVQRLLLGRALHVGHRLQRLVGDADGRGRAPRLLRLLGGDDGDGLAEVADAVDREHGLVGELEAVRLPPRDVLVRQDGVNARHPHRVGDVDLEDPRVGVRAPHRLPPQHPGGVEVARVGELAGDLGDAVVPERRVADAAEPERAAARRAHEAAASLTASKIFA